jgi:aryl-alcohol dehydrogenase-like predicted oxidoreductase
MGFGCMGMSEFYGAHDDESSLRTLERAFDLGITHFDTSNVYGRGHNERLVGRFIKNKRNRLTLASKFGVVRDPNGPENSTYDRGIDNSPAYMRRCCEESLTRLQVEVIDLYYVHRTDPNFPIEETVGALADLVQAGKIRGYGLSEVPAATLRRASAVFPPAALQSEYSLWTRDVEAEILPACKELNVAFIAYSPLGRGFLTGALRKEDLKSDDFRLTSPRFQSSNFDRNQALVREVQDFAAARGATPGQIALAWLLHRRQDVVPIPGTKRVQFLLENVGAVDISLSADDLAQLDRILPPGAAAGTRYDPQFAGAPKS